MTRRRSRRCGIGMDVDTPAGRRERWIARRGLMAQARAQARTNIPNDLTPYWLPFTPNRAFKRRPRLIVAAIKAQAEELDYAPAFQFSHPKAFELASRIAALAPADLDYVFFCNSGSERSE